MFRRSTLEGVPEVISERVYIGAYNGRCSDAVHWKVYPMQKGTRYTGRGTSAVQLKGCVLAHTMKNAPTQRNGRCTDAARWGVHRRQSRILLKGEKKATSRTGKVDGRRGKEEEVQRLWGMLYADDAGIVSRSSEGLERTMTVIVTACSAFGLTVFESKTEIMCLQTKGGGKVSFTINAAGQVCKQSSFVYLGGAIIADREPCIKRTRRIQRA